MLLQVVLGVVVLLSIVALMSVGVMFGRKPIQGSCGGVGAALGETDYECEFCGGDPDKCETLFDSGSENGKEAGDQSLAYEVREVDSDTPGR